MHDVISWIRSRHLGIPRGGTLGPADFARDPPAALPAAGITSTAYRSIVMIVGNGCIIGDDADVLSRAGYKIRSARGLNSALERIRQVRPALLIVCGPPDIELVQALRGATAIPILALLSQASEADVLDVLDAGADDCQPVTIGSQEVLMRVRSLLRRRV